MPAVVQIILPFQALDPVEVWKRLCMSHPNLLHGDSAAEVAGEVCALNEVSSKIAQRGKPHFGVVVNGEEFEYSNVAAGDHSHIWVHRCIDFSDAWKWCEPFTVGTELRQAFVYDEDYERWQNEDDPDMYANAGIPHQHLPRNDNGLPDFLAGTIIDTSANPGRRIIRKGYVEFVGSLMWLGDSFWKLTGARREQVLAQSWLRCREVPNHVLEVRALDRPFTSSRGKEGEMQNQMRDILFPRHADLGEE